MEGLTRIFLGGKLGQLFGKEWHLNVRSPAEALRAININTGGKLKEYLRQQKRDSFYKIAIDKKFNLLDTEEIKRSTGNRDIFIFPSAKGGSNTLKIIVGIILIIVGVILYAYGGAGLVKFGAFLISAGIGQVIGGIVGLLTAVGAASDQGFSEATGGSKLFANGAMVTGQGGPVNIVYGRALIQASTTPISIAYSNFDQSPNYGGNGSSYGNSDSFAGGTYMPYDVITDPTTGFAFYNQSTIPAPVVPQGY